MTPRLMKGKRLSKKIVDFARESKFFHSFLNLLNIGKDP